MWSEGKAEMGWESSSISELGMICVSQGIRSFINGNLLTCERTFLNVLKTVGSRVLENHLKDLTENFL